MVFFHVRVHELNESQRGFEVGLELGLHFFGGDFVPLFAVLDAGVENEDIYVSDFFVEFVGAGRL